MSDIFYINVDPSEEMEFQFQYCEMDWPRLGMTCQVPRCSDLVVFTTYAKYVDHFVKRHRSYKFIYSCDTCKKRIGTKCNKKNHKKQHKPPVTFTLIKVNNSEFINPGDTRMPRPPIIQEKNIEKLPEFLSHKRAELIKKRRSYADFNRDQTSQEELMHAFENQ